MNRTERTISFQESDKQNLLALQYAQMLSLGYAEGQYAQEVTQTFLEDMNRWHDEGYHAKNEDIIKTPWVYIADKTNLAPHQWYAMQLLFSEEGSDDVFQDRPSTPQVNPFTRTVVEREEDIVLPEGALWLSDISDVIRQNLSYPRRAKNQEHATKTHKKLKDHVLPKFGGDFYQKAYTKEETHQRDALYEQIHLLENQVDIIEALKGLPHFDNLDLHRCYLTPEGVVFLQSHESRLLLRSWNFGENQLSWVQNAIDILQPDTPFTT